MGCIREPSLTAANTYDGISCTPAFLLLIMSWTRRRVQSALAFWYGIASYWISSWHSNREWLPLHAMVLTRDKQVALVESYPIAIAHSTTHALELTPLRIRLRWWRPLPVTVSDVLSEHAHWVVDVKDQAQYCVFGAVSGTCWKGAIRFFVVLQDMNCVDFIENALFNSSGDICWPLLPCQALNWEGCSIGYTL